MRTLWWRHCRMDVCRLSFRDNNTNSDGIWIVKMVIVDCQILSVTADLWRNFLYSAPAAFFCDRLLSLLITRSVAAGFGRHGMRPPLMTQVQHCVSRIKKRHRWDVQTMWAYDLEGHRDCRSYASWYFVKVGHMKISRRNAITGTNPYCWTLTDPRGGIILNMCYNILWRFML